MMGNQQGQPPQWPPQSGQPPAWYPPNQGQISSQHFPRGQQPPQWQRPQQNTQYPPQWQPSPPYPQQSYQPPPPYYPQQQYYQQMPPPMRQPPPPKKGLSGCQITLIVIAALLVLSLLGSIAHPQSSATSNTDSNKTTSNAQSTDTPTIVPTKGSSIHIAPSPGPSVIGADVGTFVTRYGEPQEELSSGYFDYKDQDGKIYLTTTVENGRVNTVLDDISINWTAAQAKAACMTFLPSDSMYERKYNVFLLNSLSSVDYVYHSSYLANRFPAKDFTDENGNQTTSGTFELNVNYITDNTADCDVQVGLQST